MRIKCKKCRTTHVISDHKIRSSNISLRCKKCDRIITVKLTGKIAKFDTSRASSNKDDTMPTWCYGQEGSQEGPVTLRDLQDKVQRGIVGEKHEIWKVGTNKRTKLGSSTKLQVILSGSNKKPARAPKPNQHRGKSHLPSVEENNQPENKQDHERNELLRRVFKKREKARVDRHTDKIAGNFFNSNEAKIEPVSTESIPPPTVPQSKKPPSSSSASSPSGITSTITSQLVKYYGRRIRTGIALSLCLLLLLGAGIYFTLTYGWLSLTPTQTPNQPRKAARKTELRLDIDPSEQEVQKLRDIFTLKPDDQSIEENAFSSMTQLQNKKSQAQKIRKQELSTFYTNDEKEEVSPRIPDMNSLVAAPMNLGLPGLNDSLQEATLPEKLQEVTPVGPRRITNQLSDLHVRLVIQRHKHQIKSCLQRQLKRDPSVSGKMYVDALIKPTGRVEKVNIATPKFKGTFVEQCLVKDIMRWRFPAFKGETYYLRFPLLLSANAQ